MRRQRRTSYRRRWRATRPGRPPTPSRQALRRRKTPCAAPGCRRSAEAPSRARHSRSRPVGGRVPASRSCSQPLASVLPPTTATSSAAAPRTSRAAAPSTGRGRSTGGTAAAAGPAAPRPSGAVPAAARAVTATIKAAASSTVRAQATAAPCRTGMPPAPRAPGRPMANTKHEPGSPRDAVLSQNGYGRDDDGKLEARGGRGRK